MMIDNLDKFLYVILIFSIPICLSVRVAIIGAGPSGLSQIHAFESARKSGAQIPDVVCFEKQDDVGGQWKYSWRTGFDQYAEPVHSSMYPNLWINGPKECMEFADYTFDEHFRQPLTSFPPRTVYYDYLQGYAKRMNVSSYIQFNTVVRWVTTYSEDKQKFHIRIKDLKSDQTRSEVFDYVIVASGHFSMPNVPHLNGIETFVGRILHSHDFRHARTFVNQHVLIIGNKKSGEDIALQLYKYGAKSITISYRSKPLNFEWPKNIKEVPSVIRIDEKTVYFKDNSTRKFDAIIFCTGYQYYFPFLDDNLRLHVKNNFFPADLYKGVVWINPSRLFYLAMQEATVILNIGNAQAWYIRDIILGRLHLPSTRDQMQSDIKLWQGKSKAVKTSADAFHFFEEYIMRLINATDYPLFNIKQMVQIILVADQTRREILTYRDKTYTSALTQTRARPHRLPWLNETDDRLENFITRK